MSLLLEIERQIALEAAPVVLVNVFTLDKAHEQTFRQAWQNDAAFMQRQPATSRPSFTARSAKARPYLNYAVWESTAAFRAAFSHPEFRAKLSTYPSSAAASPHRFQKVAVPASASRSTPERVFGGGDRQWH